VDRDLPAGDLLRAVKNSERALIDAVTLFDVYEGKGMPEGKKSLAIAVRLQPRDKTLTDAEIEAVAGKIVAAALKLGGQLRS
jgi:phenylalanyl-tRNA synthetase beta chain